MYINIVYRIVFDLIPKILYIYLIYRKIQKMVQAHKKHTLNDFLLTHSDNIITLKIVY